jgi:hypothetical protein
VYIQFTDDKRYDKEETHVLFDTYKTSKEVEAREDRQQSGGSQITDFELNQIS